MELTQISKKDIIKHLRTNGTSEKKINLFESLTVDCRIAIDEKFTVILDNLSHRVGVAKRCTFHKTADKKNNSRGISIALFRMLETSLILF